MKYILWAVEKETGFPLEIEVADQAEYEKRKTDLSKNYKDFHLDERWEDLEEMYTNVTEEQSKKYENLFSSRENLATKCTMLKNGFIWMN